MNQLFNEWYESSRFDCSPGLNEEMCVSHETLASHPFSRMNENRNLAINVKPKKRTIDAERC